MGDLLDRLGLELPLVQAGMGGGLADHRLAAAVSGAGGLGQIGLHPPAALRDELDAARKLTGSPLAVNLIVPLTGRAHWREAARADVVVTHWETRPRRRVPGIWISTVGSPQEARVAVANGADGVIAQGLEAGGHTRGSALALDLLEQVRAAVPSGFPVLLAGGIAEAADVRRALDAGAVAAVAGTRFLLSDESRAHPDYKRRLVEAHDTLLTELFGVAWPRAPHRVLPNAATERWLAGDARGPGAVRALHTVVTPLVRRLPVAAQQKLNLRSGTGALDLSAAPPTVGMPAATVDTRPLYAGETVSRIADIRPAAELVRSLTP